MRAISRAVKTLASQQKKGPSGPLKQFIYRYYCFVKVSDMLDVESDTFNLKDAHE